MKGIQFVVDDAGEKRAVLLDLAEWGDLWEDFYDIMVARTRQDEEELSGQELKQETSPRPPLFGCDKGRIYMSDDFDEPLDDFEEYSSPKLFAIPEKPEKPGFLKKPGFWP